MDQGTQEWLVWRHAGIGASDSAAIFGVSRYQTKRELWKEKLFPEPPEAVGNFATAKGGTAEIQIRARYNLAHGSNCEPRLCEHDTFPFIKASLDGFCPDTARAIEIKFVGAKEYETEPRAIQKGQAHWIQCQHQMLASGLLYIDYLYSNDRHTFKQKRIFLDAEFQLELELALVNFWGYVTTKEDIGYSVDDAKPASEELGRYLVEYKATKDKKLKELMRPLVTWPRMEYNGVTVTLKGDKLTIR